MKRTSLISIFFAFARIGLFTFGGGLTMLPLLTREIVEKRGWTTEDELLDYYAIGQCTPGIIAVNTATFIGHKQGGALGGIAATLGMVAPSYVIITLVAAFLSTLMDYAIVHHALAGVRAVVCALMACTVLSLWKKSVVDAVTLVIFVLALLGLLLLPIPAIAVVICGAVAGLALHGRRKGAQE